MNTRDDALGPERIVFLRHAEEHGSSGFTEDGRPDDASLTIRGWQRAGALCHLLFPAEAPDSRPTAVFASAIAEGSETKRPQQTARPVAKLLREADPHFELITRWAKGQVAERMQDVMRRTGIVVVVWEHSRLPDCIAALPSASDAPKEWPDHRYYLLWIADRADRAYRVTVRPQLILLGDDAAC